MPLRDGEDGDVDRPLPPSGGRLAGLDLNLLTALHALLEERHVTRAGRRLGLSQPSTSALLARLRRHFDDPLLQRVGNRYELTPLALLLRERAAAAIAQVERTFDTHSSFDPATTERDYTLVLPDHGLLLLGDQIVAAFRAAAPRARLRLRHLGGVGAGEFDDVLRGVDALVMPRGLVHQYPSADLLLDTWVGIADRRRTAELAHPSVEQLATMPWVVLEGDYGEPTVPLLSRQLTGPGGLVVVAYVPDFLAAVPLIAGSDRVAVVPERLAARLAPGLGLHVFPVPFETTPLVDALWWHPSQTPDPAQSWFRGLVLEAGRRVQAAA